MDNLKYPVAKDDLGKVVRPTEGKKPYTCIGCGEPMKSTKAHTRAGTKVPSYFSHAAGKIGDVGCSHEAFVDRLEGTVHDAVVDYIFEQDDDWLKQRMPDGVTLPTGIRFKDDRFVPVEAYEFNRYKPDIGLDTNPRNEGEVFVGIEVVHTHPPEEKRLDYAYRYGHITLRIDIRQGGVDAHLGDAKALNAGESAGKLAAWVDQQTFRVMEKPRRIITDGLCQVFEKTHKQLLDMWYDDFKALEEQYAQALLKRELDEQDVIDQRQAAERREAQRERERAAEIRSALDPQKNNLARQDIALAMQDRGDLTALRKIAPHGISVGGRPITATGGLVNWDEWDEMVGKV